MPSGLSYAFGGNTGIATQQELERRRALVDALMGTRQAPRNLGEGLSFLGEAIGSRIQSGKLRREEEGATRAGSKLFNSLFGGKKAITGDEAMEPASYNTEPVEAPATAKPSFGASFLSRLQPAPEPVVPENGVEDLTQGAFDLSQAQPVPEPVAQPAPQQTVQAGPSLDELMGALNDPAFQHLDPALQKMVVDKIEQLNTPPDPMKELQLQKLQQEVAQGLRKKPIEIDGRLLDPDTFEVLYEAPEKPEKPTGNIQEYEYAKQQGFPGTLQDWEATKRGGMTIQSDGRGGFTLQQGAGVKPLTEGQSKDVGFVTRAEGAEPLLAQYENALTSYGDAALGAVPYGLGQGLKSTDYQLAEQAGNEFLTAFLRKDSGATITPQEENLYGRIYLPRPGDKKELIAQKQQSRRRAIEGINAGLPPSAIVAKEIALQKSQTSEPQQTQQPAQDTRPPPPSADDPLGLR